MRREPCVCVDKVYENGERGRYFCRVVVGYVSTSRNFGDMLFNETDEVYEVKVKYPDPRRIKEQFSRELKEGGFDYLVLTRKEVIWPGRR